MNELRLNVGDSLKRGGKVSEREIERYEDMNLLLCGQSENTLRDRHLSIGYGKKGDCWISEL